ncbi:host-nuclease inhibitor Gam family protein [Maledivibacter halophilus]|uniref:Mu-like prophage host-nuclease inhibitor protein Gam n=1 Tax=Maledivibacter halophilus TaxID=36842 RepID=A0A1T5KXY9_9FIRM|nr:host-nuclease inhibitor Gam family protein [Maledivibacter halophilus]SKC68510.1 Mu-like prophage host-nuclease inhibitor protein Gam [Maledivibacter halophilus]SKC71602.1 Mu-like prophage host-nuclease inhibitor protein Gam [Maledivibacter halophilus]SKC80257.1 Mu-like prophage host-nuclease inhibitor protein Gam [Maledivibacter halophilus]
MARVRIPDEPVLKSWDDVNLNLKEIAECEIEIEKIQGEMNRRISDVKLEAEMDAKPYKESIKTLEKQVKNFVESNRADLKGKTKFLNFGKTGFRKSTKIVLRKVDNIIRNLKSFGMVDCIKIKESVNKDVLKKYTDADIAKIGASKKVEDVFWYEVDKEKLKA